MKNSRSFLQRHQFGLCMVIVLLVMAGAALTTRQRWEPVVRGYLGAETAQLDDEHAHEGQEPDDHQHDGHNHEGQEPDNHQHDGHNHEGQETDAHQHDGHDHEGQEPDNHQHDGHDHEGQEPDAHQHDGHAHGGQEPDAHQHGGHDHEGQEPDAHQHDGHAHGGQEPDAHQHGGQAHDDANSLELSELAWKNIGLRTGVVELQDYTKTVSMPAMVVERPGRSRIEITAPLTGIVTRVYPLEGEVVEPGQPLFDLRLTHEDMVTAQREYLRLVQAIDVVKWEISRLQSVGEGVIAGRRVLEQQYEQQKLEAALHAQRQGLLLHGLSEKQVETIGQSRLLLQSITVVVPSYSQEAEPVSTEKSEPLLHVQRIVASRGEQVSAGALMGVLADHGTLYVEGQAFEDDSQRLLQAVRDQWPVEVSALSGTTAGKHSEPLKILYVSDQIDPQSRTLHYYLVLPNELVRDEARQGHRFVAWKHRPGQRMEVKIPINQPWRDQIVLPPEAVVAEGAEAFVFAKHGDHFDRTAVHIVYQDQDAVVVENDGSLVGSTLALSGAYQMQLALKNKSGGGVDPHAGHNH